MQYDINEALLRLENNLNEVDSARQQVEKIITCNKSLAEDVRNYISKLGTCLTEIKKWIKDFGDFQNLSTEEIKKAVEKIISSCDSVILDFNTKLQQELSSFSEENAKLAKSVADLETLHDDLKTAINEINTIKEKIDEISDLLKSSQESQDEILTEIKSVIEKLPATLHSLLDEFSQKVISKIDSSIGHLANMLSSISSKCDSISSEITDIKSYSETTIKKIHWNRWIIIIGFILLGILHFIKI